jgi:hypothetical protein
LLYCDDECLLNNRITADRKKRKRRSLKRIASREGQEWDTGRKMENNKIGKNGVTGKGQEQEL